MSNQPDSFIDDAFLQQLEKLKMVSRKRTRQSHRGELRSWQSGEGFEFLDFRKYHLGDDLRYVDWSVYGRLDKLFIKLFHAEKGQTAHILLDTSRSMQNGSPSKDITAKKIAAALSYICLSNLDKTGLMAFSSEIVKIKPPARGKKQYLEVLNFLRSLQPADQTDIIGSLQAYAASCKNPGIAIIISDFFDPKGYQEGLRALAYRDFDINLIQVMSHDEIEWPRTGSFELNDCETGEKKVIFVDRHFLEKYTKKISSFITGIRNYCRHYGLNYYLCDTRIPFENLLRDYLTKGALFR